MNPDFDLFKKQITSPIKFRLFLLSKLPAAFFSGLHVTLLNEQQAVVSVKQKWFTTNPFRSMYFAVLSMAAEMSTGLAGFAATYQRKPAVSMLIIKMEGSFYKKATGVIRFSCADMQAVNDIVEEAVLTGVAQTIVCHSTGVNERNETVAEFSFTWSFKVKSSFG